MSDDAGVRALKLQISEMRNLHRRTDPLAQAEGIRASEALIAEHRGGEDAAVKEVVGRLRVERARLLSMLGYGDRALAELGAVIAAFPGSPVGAVAMAARSECRRVNPQPSDEVCDAVSADIEDQRLLDIFADSAVPEVRELRIAARGRQLRSLIDRAEHDGTEERWIGVRDAANALVQESVDDLADASQAEIAGALLQSARAWRRLTAFDDDRGEEDGEAGCRYPDGSSAAMQAADRLFDQFAHSPFALIRGIVADSETEAAASCGVPRECLSLVTRDLALEEEWEGQPIGFFARALLSQADAWAQIGDTQQAHDLFAQVIRKYGSFAPGEELAAVASIVAEAHGADIDLLCDAGREVAALAGIRAFSQWMDGLPAAERTDALRQRRLEALRTGVDLVKGRAPAVSPSNEGLDGTQVGDLERHDSISLTEAERAWVAAVDELLTVGADDPMPAIRRRTAQSAYELASGLRERNHFAEAEAAYRELIARFAADRTPTIREQYVAYGYLNLGYLLLALLDRPGEALAVYDEFLERFRDSTSAEMRELVAKVNSSRVAATTALYDRGVTADDLGEEGDPSVRAAVRASRDRGIAHVEAEQYEAAVAEFDAIIAAHPTPRGELRGRVADAMVRKGYCLNRLHRWQESAAAHERLLTEFGADLDTTIEKDVALGLSNYAVALDKLGRPEAEIDAYRQILDRWSRSTVPYLVERCARTAWRKGITEEELGRDSDAEQSYRHGARYLSREPIDTRVEGAASAVNLSVFLRKRGRPEEAAVPAEQVILRLTDVGTPQAREQLAKAYLALARARAQSSGPDAAWTAYVWVLGPGGEVLSENLRSTVNREFLHMNGGPLKAAWRRLRRVRKA